MSSRERVAVALIAAVSLTLRAIAFFHYRFDSDEPQHLHVTWGWTVGLLQYRDVFDNHTPLFHMITAPILAAVGERPGALFFMRAAMLPLFAIVIVATYLIAARLYSTRVAVWSAVILSLVPTFFLKSLEYRSDNLWSALSMIALLLLLRDPPPFFLIGLLLGAAFATSVKSALIVIAIAAAVIITRIMKPSLRAIAVGAAGFAIVPGLIAGYFILEGAWSDLVYGVWGFNSGLVATRPYVWIYRLSYPVTMALIIFLARKMTFLGVFAAVYLATLVAFWPLISPRDVLAIIPLLVIFVVAAIDRSRVRVPALTTLVVLSVATTVYYANYFRNRTREFTTAMNQVLTLSKPEEPVLDQKSESIFRRNPFFYPLETVARESLRSGLIKDTIPEDVIRARCYVAQADGSFIPPRGRRFLLDNFMDMGRYRAAGQWIKPDGSFTIAVPGPYVIVNYDGEARGSLDGQLYAGRADLPAGTHRFDRENAGEQIAVLWAPAFDRGFSPFHLKDRDF